MRHSSAPAAAIAKSYDSRDTAAAIRDIMALCDRANQYVDSRKPWLLAKDPKNAVEVQSVCTQALNLFRVLMIYLEPVLPNMAARARAFLQEPDWTWAAAATPLLATSINAYEALAVRLDPKAVARLVEPEAPAPAASALTASTAPTAPTAPAASTAPTAPTAARPGSGGASDAATLAAAASVEGNLISIDDFLRIDLRVAKILAAEFIVGADKLLKLRVDVGELGEREIFAGIRAAYDPAALVGRLIVVVANLEPRTMRFGVSEGMMLAAGPGGKEIFALSPDSGAAPGMRVK